MLLKMIEVYFPINCEIFHIFFKKSTTENTNINSSPLSVTIPTSFTAPPRASSAMNWKSPKDSYVRSKKRDILPQVACSHAHK